MYKYYIEIKNRIFLLVVTWLSTVFISYMYKEILLFLCIKPTINVLTNTYFIFTNLTEIFSTYLCLIYFIGNQILLVFILYHILIYISPGLYYYEYKNLKLIFSLGVFFWIFSIVILQKTILPFSWQFFLSFHNSLTNQTFSLYFEAKINEYLNFYITLYYLCNFNFQVFILLYILLDYMKKNLNFIKQFRKLFYFLFVLTATIITPPDIISQIALSMCIITLYELIIFTIILKVI